MVSSNNVLHSNHLKIYPICSESYGVRSFCIKVKTPDLVILLDPGCALGPYKKFKIPHFLEYERLQQFSTKILIESTDCDFLFISHYHHDHFKPNLEDNEYIQSSKKLFKSLYSDKKVVCKQYQTNTNFNQKQRGEKFHKDLSNFNIETYRIGRDSFLEDSSFYQRNSHLRIKTAIKDSLIIGNTHLIFPQEFLHGMRLDGKEIYVQPLIISYENEFFYFFPDVQGMPNRNDYELLIALKNEFEAINHQYVSDHQSMHIIAMGGPITYLWQKQNAIHLLEQSTLHTSNIAQNFDQVIIDHHLIRDPNFRTFWREISQHSNTVFPFNRNLFEEMEKDKEKIPVLEFNRERLYKFYRT